MERYSATTNANYLPKRALLGVVVMRSVGECLQQGHIRIAQVANGYVVCTKLKMCYLAGSLFTPI